MYRRKKGSKIGKEREREREREREGGRIYMIYMFKEKEIQIKDSLFLMRKLSKRQKERAR